MSTEEKVRPVSLRLIKGSPECVTFAAAINQGIDSYLEAVTASTFQDCGSVLQADLAEEDIPVIVRRLLEAKTPTAAALALIIQKRQLVASAGFSPVARAYVEAALWTSYDNSDDRGGDPMENNYGLEDLSPDLMAEISRDCAQFCEDNAALISEAGLRDDQVGHDFWLTRNHHGCGFWDRGLGTVGRQLTDAAHAWGSHELYVGDDGLIYGQ
jgi:hypothetical protein